jgi:protein TonB
MNSFVFLLSTMLLGLNPYPEPTQFESASFPGGEAAMSAYFQQHLDYPLVAREQSIEGSVTVSFIVEKDGSVTAAKVLDGIGIECDEAAIIVVSNMPKWNPALFYGETVRSKNAVRLVFRLN